MNINGLDMEASIVNRDGNGRVPYLQHHRNYDRHTICNLVLETAKSDVIDYLYNKLNQLVQKSPIVKNLNNRRESYIIKWKK